VTPYPEGVDLLTGHERRNGNWCWRPRGTPVPLLIHTRSGRGALRVSDGEHSIAPGTTVLWAAGASQDFGCYQDEQPWDIVWAHFRPRSHWYSWLTWPMLGPGVASIPLPPRARARIDAALLEMDSSAHSSRSPLAADLALNALERALLWLAAANPGPQQLDDRLHDGLLFIASHLDHELSVAAIADSVQLSPSRFSHLFKQQIGISPARFVEMRRIERGQELLESSSLPVGAIAEMTGFSSPFYFATRFRGLTGMSPSDWRRARAHDGRG
jgi:AraC family transcriptional regulator of arabinose operon